MLRMINPTHKVFTSFFVFLLFSDIMVSSLMALMVKVAKKYVRKAVNMNGKAIIFNMIFPRDR